MNISSVWTHLVVLWTTGSVKSNAVKSDPGLPRHRVHLKGPTSLVVRVVVAAGKRVVFKTPITFFPSFGIEQVGRMACFSLNFSSATLPGGGNRWAVVQFQMK